MKWIGVVDTMFARVDMGAIALAALRAKPDFGVRFDIARRGVWIRPMGKVIYLTPPFIVSDAELAQLTRAIVEELTEGV